jgi:PAS domain S-box-containing protein
MAMAAKMAVAYDNARLYLESTTYASRLEAEISERAKVESELAESRARLAGIIDSAMDAIVTVDSDQHIVRFNKAAEEMFRCRVADVIGESIDRFVPARFRSSHAHDFRNFGETGVTTRAMGGTRAISGLRADGEEFPLEASISQIEIQGQKLYTVIMRDVTERKRAEEARGELSRLLDESLNEIYVFDAQTLRFIQVNQRACQNLGYTLGELRAMTPVDFKPEFDAEKFEELLGPLRRGEKSKLVFVTKHKRKDGSLYDVEVHLQMAKFEGRSVFVAIILDISERIQAEASLRESERRYREMLGNVHLISMTLDREGRITFCNKYLLQLTGWSREEVLGDNWFDTFVPPEKSAQLKTVFAELLDDQPSAWHHENEILTRSGERRLVRWNNSVLLSTENEVIGVASIGEDVTERKRAELNIHNLNRVYAVLSDINQMIVRTREPQKIFAEACRIAVEKGKFLMAWIGRLDKQTQRIDPVAWAGAEEGYLQKIDLNLLDDAKAKGPTATATREGRHVIANDLATDPLMEPWRADALKRGYRSLGAFPLRVDGEVVGNFNLYAAERDFFDESELALLDELAMDISFALEVDRRETERQQAEESLRAKSEELAMMTQQLWQSSKLATMGELAASIAHELNNPLATVSLRAENLLMQMPEDSDQRKPLEIVVQEVDRMAALVKNLLQFSRRRHRQVSTVDVREEIANSIEFVHYHLRSHQIEVVREFSDPLPTIQADRQQLRQLFLNLLTNANDAMPAGGKLTVRTAVSHLAETSAVAIELADTGEGITAENMEKIWDPFFTTKPEGKGTGLGLAIARRIVEEHGGAIEIQSEFGHGTTVRMVFPATSNGEPH